MVVVAERQAGIVDPSCIVIDEVLGMGISLLFIPKEIALYGIAFIVFRFFDISKVFPIWLLEKHVPHGWGIMADDVLAGFMTLLVLYCYFSLQIL